MHIGDVTVSGSLRSRVEVWNWFAGSGNNDYALSDSIFRLSFQQWRQRYDWNIELAAPVLLGLPRDSVAPGAQGQLGMGGSYFAANGNKSNAAFLFPKQAYLEFKFQSGTVKQRVQLGRSEFTDGGETVPSDATLAAVKRDHIAQRLLASFGFSDVGRSFDGIQYVASSGATNLTFAAVRPTRGVFQTDGWGEININVFYGAVTRETGSSGNAGEWRVFAMGYNDQRQTVLKVDNRPQSLRTGDHQHIAISTFGGHYLRTVDKRSGTADVLFWAAAQAGTWGALAQRSTAFAAEAGWQPTALRRVKPCVRGGYGYGSGDGNPNDKTHGTFFQMLPTPRIYARFPFYNMMNNRDAFGEIMVRPAKAVTVRSDLHQLTLASGKDLWYSGGGAYQPWTFGYTGRPSNGHSGLATLYDVSADWRLNTRLSTSFYYGHAEGSSAIAATYFKGKSADFGYVEMNWRF
jgi:Alginate export